MDEQTLKQYHAFCNDCWKYFKKYAWDGVNAGLNDINFWDAYSEGDQLIREHSDVEYSHLIISAIQNELWKIGGAPIWSKERCDEAFQYAMTYGGKASYIMHWVDQVTAGHPERIDYILKKLSELMKHKGHDIDEDTVKTYAEAGWVLRI